MGALAPVPGSPFPAGSNPRSVTVDPTGSFVYVANCGGGLCFGPGSVSAYAIGTDGSLAPVPGSPFPAGSGPVSVTVEPTGHFAYVANKFSNDVWAYAIGIDGIPGSLTLMGAFPAGSVPVSVTTAAVP
jgi:DNA-binding beta-propeller fold protein YncE